MSINIETAIRWFSDRKGRVTYSMSYRNGPNSYDCSSSVYFALMEAGAITAGWAVNTEYQHDWLVKNGYKLISENRAWDAKRGDIFIWGRRGQSAGSGGHTGIFIDADNIIHCNYARNGISVNEHDVTWVHAGRPYYYVYRLANNTDSQVVTSKPSSTPRFSQGNLEVLAGQTMAGMHGKGAERQAKLGKRYTAVQTIINERLKIITAQESHRRLAKEVLAGHLGTGEERKKNLGSYYQAVQDIVNKGVK